jgi:hypothetical protein
MVYGGVPYMQAEVHGCDKTKGRAELFWARMRDAVQENVERLCAAHNLGQSLHGEGKCAEAERMFREVLAMQKRELGPGASERAHECRQSRCLPVPPTQEHRGAAAGSRSRPRLKCNSKCSDPPIPTRCIPRVGWRQCGRACALGSRPQCPEMRLAHRCRILPPALACSCSASSPSSSTTASALALCLSTHAAGGTPPAAQEPGSCAYRDGSMPLPPHSLQCCGCRLPCRSTAADCAQTQIMSLPPHWQSLQRLSLGCSQAPSGSCAGTG